MSTLVLRPLIFIHLPFLTALNNGEYQNNRSTDSFAIHVMSVATLLFYCLGSQGARALLAQPHLRTDATAGVEFRPQKAERRFAKS